MGDPDGAEGLSRSVREAWAAFARTGVPAAKGLPTWPAYDAHRLTMVLGRTVDVVPDPLAAARRRCAPLRDHALPPTERDDTLHPDPAARRSLA